MPPKKVTQELTPTKRKLPFIGAIKATTPMSYLIITATLGGYFAADFRNYPGKVKDELENITGFEGGEQMRYTFGLQKGVFPNDRNSYVLFWEDETDNEENKEHKYFLPYLFKLLEAKDIDGTKGFKIATDVPFVKEMFEEWKYTLSELPLENEKGKIDGLVRERWTIEIEFTIDDDTVNVVLTNAWRFRKPRLAPLSLELTRTSELQRVNSPEANSDAAGADPWVSAGSVQKTSFEQWIKDAEKLFGSMPVHYNLYIPEGVDECDIRGLLRSTLWSSA